jgi:hypothetical protein
MMEQLQMQTAESLLQRQGMELQNKIREDALAESIGERKAQVDEYNTFSTLSKQVSDYLNNPKEDAVFPVVPAFKSKTYRLEADKMLNNLEKYSARAKLLKATNRAEAQADAIAASTLNKAIELGAIKRDANGKLDVDVPLLNQRAEEQRKANIAKTTAQTTSILTNLELSRDRLNALIANNASDAEIAKARLAVEKSFKEARVKLDEEELGFKKSSTATKLGIDQQKVDIAKNNLDRLIKENADKNAIEQATLNYKKALAEESSSLNREKFDFAKGLQLEKLALEKIRVEQLGKRTDAYVQKILQPAKNGEIKLNAVDDRLVKKAADDIANKQGISDAIGYEIGVLDDPSIDEYVKRASAQNILKILNSAEGKDAVGVEESKRLGQFLEFQLNPVRGLATGRLFGTDLPRFVEQISIKKEELDTRVNEGMNRVNSIYRKYGKDIPAGTSQMPSRSAMITAPATQAMSSTNSPAMSGTNSMSEISFESTAEARAKGKKTGDFVIIKGVKGNLK